MIFDNEPFVFIDPPQSLPGAGFILSTQEPFYIGKVIKMNQEEGKKFIQNSAIQEYEFCMGYWVAIIAKGSLLDSESYSREALEEMADFYLNYRIIPNAGRYKRYEL